MHKYAKIGAYSKCVDKRLVLLGICIESLWLVEIEQGTI